MIRYVFKNDPPILKNAKKADPQEIGDALATIAVAHSGRLIPEAVVAAAANRRSPLHPHFEWKDDIAAHNYRLDQARAIIGMIRTVDDEEPDQEPKPAFISLQDHGVAYRTTAEVVDSRRLQLIVLQQAERDLTAWQKRYHMLQDVCALVTAAAAALAAKRAELETGQNAAA